MFLTMGIALYTSRVVLDVLGVEDYGIYNIVGGVVAMLSFLSSALTGATSRFLTYELGRNDQVRLSQTFSSALCIYIGLAIILMLLLETFGLWFVTNKLIIPPERMDAALFAYHFSIFACVVQLVQLPFYSAIISHERMDAFAYISIFDVLMKLISVYILKIGLFDKLELYSVLIFFISTFSSLLYISFASKKFSECKFRFQIEKKIAKPILFFSGWDLFGNFSVVARSQGLNILQNIFFGPIVNAATGISNQVLSAIMGFAENFLTAVKPQIVKYYATNEIARFNSLIINTSKYCTLLLFIVSFPILIEARFILGVWLVDVPDYTVIFCQLSIVNNWISILFRPIIVGIQATGNAKRISLINGSIYILVVPLSYIMLSHGASPIFPFVLNIILLFIGHFFFSLRTLKLYVNEFSINNFIRKSFVIFCFIASITMLFSYFIQIVMDEGWFRFVLNTISSILLILVLSNFVAIDKETRMKLVQLIKAKFKI